MKFRKTRDVHASTDTEVVLPVSNLFSPMLFTIAAILLVLWLLGLITSYTVGGFLHLLLVVAIIIVLVRLVRGQSPL